MTQLMNRHFITLLLGSILILAGRNAGASLAYDTQPKRLTVRSPWFEVNDADVELQASYSGYDLKTQKRFSRLAIGNKALEMIADANDIIVGTAFLFDVLNSDGQPVRDIVDELTTAIEKKKKQNPDIVIAIVLDPLNKAYGKRVSPAVQRLVDCGVDIFYTDLISTKSATRLGVMHHFRRGLRVADTLLLGALTPTLKLVTGVDVPIKNPLNEKGTSVQSLVNALSLKANHRKLLVTDINGTYDCLVSSANPHNASIPSTNFGVSAKGDIAKYVYMVMREDIRQCIEHDECLWSRKNKKYHTNYLTNTLPPLSVLKKDSTKNSSGVEVCFTTESCIRDEVLRMLKAANGHDEIRIQMFYLSHIEIIDEIIEAAKRAKRPVRVILDPSKDAFGKEKDGTPNRQVAAYLMQKKKELDLNLVMRWYETHGEQNHAKIMTITNEATGKYELINGSANWTGKNLNDINLEANITVRGSKRIVNQYNQLFDLFWGNTDGKFYTTGYRGKYEKHTGMRKWIDGERWGYVAW